ncbi:SHOCT domain-containing protein [Pseudonocardia nigra]|uniref:SHOCT domain-containing protein n=1 Tax=Pseudonocardia nigra TaxID=1921578 RepID=UPI001C5FBFB4|nr:SHOCT domain-containing protein [Pseudonocardia nigra]
MMDGGMMDGGMMDGGMMGDGMMGDGMMGAMGIWGILAILTLLAVLVVAVLASIWLVRKLREDGRTPTTTVGAESAHEALRRRYAAGEIDDDEYEHRLAALNRR